MFVDFERINYATSEAGQDEALLQYYFVFLREKEASKTDVLSRVLRLCRVRIVVNGVRTKKMHSHPYKISVLSLSHALTHTHRMMLV